jgi:hypothetical protein
MSLLYPAGQAPYLAEPELTSAPTGISWQTIPSGSQITQQQRIAERWNILGRATARADGVVNQILRATLNTEQVSGPDYRVTIQVGSGNGRVILSRWPILSITSVQVAPNNVFPRQWTTLPAGYWDVEHPTIGLYDTVAPSAAGDGGQSIVLPPGYVNWCNGRNGVLLRVSYINGWPHTALTAVAAQGAMSISVDDCTGWAITGEFGQQGAAGIIYDSGQQETVQVTAASVASGPGTLTLSSALTFTHQPNVMVTTLPQSVIDAMIQFSVAEALIRGATSTTLKQIPGGAGGDAGGKGMGPDDYIKAGEKLLAPFKRTL